MTDQATMAVTIQTPDDPWDQTSRLAARSSPLYDLVVNNQPSPELAAELVAAMTPELRATFSRALEAVEAELAFPNDDQEELLVVGLSEAITLTGGQGSAEWRKEWILVALKELSIFPASLVFWALPMARHKVRVAGHFVPTVIEMIEDKHRRLLRERQVLRQVLDPQ